MLKIFILVFATMFLLPTIQNMVGFCSPGKLSGVESKAPFPRMSLNSLLDGSFQNGFESWYSKVYGLRNYFVRTENQVNYSVFNQITTGRLVLGKENQLYERFYIVDYLKWYKQQTKKEIQEFALNLKKLQDYLEKKGVKFLFIISPNKAAIYPEYIPDNYLAKENTGDNSNYDKLIPYLNEYSINYVDGNAFCLKLKDSNRYCPFPKGGTHWNYYAAFLFTQEITKKVARMLGEPLNLLICENIEVLDVPFGTDADIARLSNIWTPSVFIDKSIYPAVKQITIPRAAKPKVLFVGGSFVGALLHWINKFDVFAEGTEFNRYYTKKIADKGREIFSKDVIILETNFQAISQAGFGFVEAVLNTSEYCQEIMATTIPQRMRVNEILKLPVTIKNISSQIWNADDDKKPLSLSYHWYDRSGNKMIYGGLRTRILSDILPGNSIEIKGKVKAPASPGEYVLKLTMVRDRVAWFDQQGAKTLDIPITVTE